MIKIGAEAPYGHRLLLYFSENTPEKPPARKAFRFQIPPTATTTPTQIRDVVTYVWFLKTVVTGDAKDCYVFGRRVA